MTLTGMPLAVSELWDDLLRCLDLRGHDEESPFNEVRGHHDGGPSPR